MNSTLKSTILALSLAFIFAGCGDDSSHGGPSPFVTQTQHIYVLNKNDDTIGQFQIGDGGKLSPLSTPTVSTGHFPLAMTMDPNGSYLYTANTGDASVSQFTISATGELTEAYSRVSGGDDAEGIAVTPDGRFVYVLNPSLDEIKVFTANSGKLDYLKSITAESALNMGITPSGKFAYVVTNDSKILEFLLDGDGDLLPLATPSVTSEACPTGPLAFARAGGNGLFLYVLSCATDLVETYSIDQDDGNLTLVGTTHTGASPQGMAVVGSNLYVANAYDSAIGMFSIGVNGMLTALSTPTIASGTMPENLVADLTGQYAYVIDYADDKITQFSIYSDGSLHPSANPSLNTGVSPIQIIVRKPPAL